MNTFQQKAAAMRCAQASLISRNTRRLFSLPFSFLPLLALLLSSSGVWGQSVNDYRSAGNGDWNALTTWERYDGAAWVTPTAVDGTPVNLDGAITVQTGDTVTVTATVNVDQVLIESGAMVIVNTSVVLRVQNSTDPVDLTLDGTIDVSGTVGKNGATTVEINGTIINRNAVSVTGGGAVLNFNANSTYIHSRNGGTIPPATTWDVLSTCELTSIINNLPSGINQTFGNFIWNCPLQTAFLNLSAGMAVAGNMEIISTGTLPLLGGLRLPNNLLTVGGNFTMADGILRLSNTDTDRTLAVGGDFSMTGGEIQVSFGGAGAMGVGTLQVAGDFSHTGGIITDLSLGTGNGVIEFNGNQVSQLFTSSVVLSGEINFVVDSLAILQMADDFSVITGDGTFTLQPGATLGITSPGGITASDALGNVQVTGIRTYSPNAHYLYNGSFPQVTGDGLPLAVDSLSIGNSGDGVTLSQPVAVDSALVFTLGVLHTSDVDSLTINPGALAVNASAMSHVNGPVVKIGGDDFTFPIGKDGIYAPLSISMLDNATDVFRSEYFATAPLDSLSFGTDVERVSLMEYWDLDKRSAEATSVIITLSWRSTSGVTDPADLLVIHYDETAAEWTSQGIGTFTPDPMSGTIESGVEVSSFSFFTLGSSNPDPMINPLPIELVSFTAAAKGKTVQLDWRTASELNNAFFEIERSANGRDFENIGKIAGAGTSQTPLDYEFTDILPLNGWNYYRLRQVDFDGQFSYSPIEAVLMANAGEVRLLAFPNPANSELNLKTDRLLQAGDRIEIYDYTGRQVLNVSASDAMNGPVAVSQLSAGTYIVRLRTAQYTVSASFVKQ